MSHCVASGYYLVPWFRRWRNLRKPPKQFVTGMTLAPGESTVIDVEIPPELAEELGELAENGATVTFEAGSTATEGDSLADIISFEHSERP